MRVLLTAGATREALDDVRFLSNVSTGRTGWALAGALAAAGHQVGILVGEGAAAAVPGPADVETFGSARDLEERLRRRLGGGGWDAVVMAAAVADYRPARVSRGKLGSGAPARVLRLVRTAKILPRLKSFAPGPLTVVGFKLTSGASARARRQAVAAQFRAGGVDVVVHNDLGAIRAAEHGHPFTVHLGRGGAAASQSPDQGREVIGAQALARVLADAMRERAGPAPEAPAAAGGRAGAQAGPRTLLLALGNTTIRGAVLRGGRLTGVFSAPAGGGLGPLGRRVKGPIEAAALCSVTPARTAAVRRFVLKSWGAPAVVLEPGSAHGLRVDYRRPSELGSDRLAAALGARARWPGRNVLVVDCGTATTVTALRRDGVLCGGAILPGLGLWGAALSGATAQLPPTRPPARPPRALGRSPREAIASGVYHGHVGALRELLRLTADEAFGTRADVVVGTGGGAPLMAGAGLFDAWIPGLVLCGLAEFAQSRMRR